MAFEDDLLLAALMRRGRRGDPFATGAGSGMSMFAAAAPPSDKPILMPEDEGWAWPPPHGDELGPGLDPAPFEPEEPEEPEDPIDVGPHDPVLPPPPADVSPPGPPGPPFDKPPLDPGEPKPEKPKKPVFGQLEQALVDVRNPWPARRRSRSRSRFPRQRTFRPY